MMRMLMLILLLHLQRSPIPQRSPAEFNRGNRIEGKVVDDQNKPYQGHCA
jgi:hypothetical protein